VFQIYTPNFLSPINSPKRNNQDNESDESIKSFLKKTYYVGGQKSKMETIVFTLLAVYLSKIIVVAVMGTK